MTIIEGENFILEDTNLASLIDIVKASLNASKRYCFILGAGASRSSGIKTGAEMAEEWLEYLEKNEKTATQEWLRNENINKNDPGSHYSKIYGRRFRVEPTVGFIKLQEEMEKAIPSPGYYYLAEILDRTHNKLVITTNFDSLTEDSLFIFKAKKALVITHENLAEYIDVLSDRPTIIKIHRDLLLQPKNNEADVKILSRKWTNSLKNIMALYVPIVIGYGGNDGSLMNFLEGNSSKEKYIYWCYKTGNPVNERIRNLLEKYQGFLVPINDFDDTLYRFGINFGYNFSVETIHTITSERARKLINKYHEWIANRQKSIDTNDEWIANWQEKIAAKKPKSKTETMTCSSFEDLFNRNNPELKKQIAKERNARIIFPKTGKALH